MTSMIIKTERRINGGIEEAFVEAEYRLIDGKIYVPLAALKAALKGSGERRLRSHNGSPVHAIVAISNDEVIRHGD